jgi:TRAP transporter TAXI family solute receptor
MRGGWRGRALLLGALLLVAAASAACGGGSAPAIGTIRIATGEKQGVYFEYGQALAGLIREEMPDVEVDVLTTAASMENLQLVTDRQADVGFTQADVAAEWASRASLVALARLYDDHVHVVVPAQAPVRTLADLRGRRISTGATGSGTEVTANRLLTVAGLNPFTDVIPLHLGLDESVTALRQGGIEAFFFSGGLPVIAITNLARDIPIRLLDLRAYVAPMRRQFGEQYSERVVPRSTYGTIPVATVGIANYLVVRPDMPEDLAYTLTRLLFDGRDTLARAHPAGARLNMRSAINTHPLGLHPGAARFYRERKT